MTPTLSVVASLRGEGSNLDLIVRDVAATTSVTSSRVLAAFPTVHLGHGWAQAVSWLRALGRPRR